MNNLFSLRSTPFRSLALATSLTVTLGLSSCEVTDLTPQNALSEATVFSDPARVALAVTGVYNAAQSGFYDPLNGGALATRGYPFGAASSELDDARGEDVVDMAGFFGIVYGNSITPSSPNLVNMWSGCYSVINQANVTLAGVRQAAASGIITADQATIYEGELLFLRALAHHELVIHFSQPYTLNGGTSPGVPYRDIAINTEEAVTLARAVDRGTVANVYDKMLADLDAAESKLPIAGTGSRATNTRVTRATKGAAIALKQRLRQHQGNWAKVIEEGNKLISGVTAPFTSPTTIAAGPLGPYALAPTPQAAFPGGATIVAENIFSIENSSDDNPSVNGALPSVYGSRSAAQMTNGTGRGLLAISPILFNAPFFTCDDLRRTQLMQLDPGTGPRYVTRKYKEAATGADYAPIIRYAEVILNQAEANARTGNPLLALAQLNAVRNRAVTNVAEQYTAALTGNALIQAILNERRIEFVAEGFRWDDIHRLSGEKTFSTVPGGGIPAKFSTAQVTAAAYACNTPTATPGTKAVPMTGDQSSFLFLWPIPSLETANNPVLAAQQNPGY
ncbi:RagB/SusD family nutrient uptake outer membrane protein [Hymenobacter cellulosivorans]|uniref:RagB/SusD family nutrient uptake outer membrane protein n=1 Tax=Hymenobacter cellulosivorans TaxID=2932249 RepID=A0ABY4F9K6_9BACT|nr:RagB/SusD family nutrient uptake outer membrane protein [Hymenobacter cellulosivorans]UOQ52861.1 RagB/SusD family nutrient uptake outer membrane protein [Hymenobacter cellulosivorans]